MKRSDIINKIILKKNYTSYLEIGLDDGVNFSKINIGKKVSVDPALNEYSHAKPTYKMTSDEFFKQNDQRFDIIFIDGLHHSEQVYKDIVNSLNSLNNNGAVICHDMNPLEKGQQLIPRKQRVWTGDCWKSWVKLRTELNGFEMYVVDTDWGVGIIQKNDNHSKVEISDDLVFENLDKNRKKWLNLITINEFNKLWG